MPVIQTVKDPATRKDVKMAEGVIKRVNVSRIHADGSARESQIKSGPKAGTVIRATHRYSLLLEKEGDSVWIGFGDGEVKNLKYEKQFQVKNDEGKYIDLVEGIELSVYPIVEDSWTTEDGTVKTSIKGKRKNIAILSMENAKAPAPAGQQQSGGQSQSNHQSAAGAKKFFGNIIEVNGNLVTIEDTKSNAKVALALTDEQLAQVVEGGRLGGDYDPSNGSVSVFKPYGPVGSGGKSNNKDMTGVETGHALNGALELHRRGMGENILELAKMVNAVTLEHKSWYGEQPSGKGLSDYDRGSAVGNAILNGCRAVSGSSITELAVEIGGYTKWLLNDVVPALTEHIREVHAANAPKAQAPVETPNKPKTESKPKAQEPKQPAQQQAPAYIPASGHVDMSIGNAPFDFDEDIPF